MELPAWLRVAYSSTSTVVDDRNVEFVCLLLQKEKYLVPCHTVGNHVTFYTYIRTERVSIFVIISLMLNEFSYRKVQIPHRFL